jgi:prolyl-tRNA editing enzyme YbaK/EbsC (Cys-tRNA(Pro) deacylase)
MSDLPASALKVRDAARQAGLAVEIVVHDRSTHTAQDAAQACGCNVAQIVKSLVYRGVTTRLPLLLLVSGANRVDEQAVARYVGEKLSRPDAEDVLEITGFPVGGVPPLGHARALRTYLDADLLGFDVVWAAGGTNSAMFAVDPDKLRTATGAIVIAVD